MISPKSDSRRPGGCSNQHFESWWHQRARKVVISPSSLHSCTQPLYHFLVKDFQGPEANTTQTMARGPATGSLACNSSLSLQAPSVGSFAHPKEPVGTLVAVATLPRSWPNRPCRGGRWAGGAAFTPPLLPPHPTLQSTSPQSAESAMCLNPTVFSVLALAVW